MKTVTIARSLFLVAVSLAGFAGRGWARDPAWFNERMKLVESIDELPLEERYLRLGKLARIGHFPPLDEEQETVFKAAQRTLLSIPGHAEYFAKQIRSYEALYEAGRGHEVQGSALWDFETLGQLPSPETVRVLGSFLDDEKNRIEPIPGADVAPIAANNLLAARAFHSLKIVSPPLQKRPGDYDDIQPWRLWFAQVQAGNRTFRFEGDPQEYNLAGPVAKVVEPVASRSGSNRSNPSSQEALAKPSKLPVVSLIGAIALLAAAIWLALKKRSSAAAG